MEHQQYPCPSWMVVLKTCEHHRDKTENRFINTEYVHKLTNI